MNDKLHQARWLAVLAATAIALYVCWLMLQPFVGVLGWATVLVIVSYPMHKRLVARIGHPSLSAFISSLLVITIAVLPLSLIALAVTRELGEASRNLPAQIAALLDRQSPATGGIVRWLEQYTDLNTLRAPHFIVDRLSNMSGTIVGQSIGFMGGVIGGIVKGFFVVFTMYYLFRDGDHILNALTETLPLKRRQSEAIFERAREVINASVYGVVSIAMLQGTLGGLAFWVLGLPSPILWAVVMTFICMIPVAGSFIIWLPASIYLAMTGHWTKAGLLFLWGILVISTIDNFVRPKLIRGRTKLHELLVFFSVIGGLRLFGVLGIVLGPVVLAITLALLDMFRHAGREEEQFQTERRPIGQLP